MDEGLALPPAPVGLTCYLVRPRPPISFRLLWSQRIRRRSPSCPPFFTSYTCRSHVHPTVQFLPWFVIPPLCVTGPSRYG
jgi:hypothetical protein